MRQHCLLVDNYHQQGFPIATGKLVPFITDDHVDGLLHLVTGNELLCYLQKMRSTCFAHAPTEKYRSRYIHKNIEGDNHVRIK